MKYCIRYFFDYGSGTCFWSANEAANKVFGYAVEIQKLPLSQKARGRINNLILHYDSSLDWNNPGGPSLWGKEEWIKFYSEAEDVLNEIRRELQDEFDIRDEHKIQ